MMSVLKELAQGAMVWWWRSDGAEMAMMWLRSMSDLIWFDLHDDWKRMMKKDMLEKGTNEWLNTYRYVFPAGNEAPRMTGRFTWIEQSIWGNMALAFQI
jgi:hypothetical protein